MLPTSLMSFFWGRIQNFKVCWLWAAITPIKKLQLPKNYHILESWGRELSHGPILIFHHFTPFSTMIFALISQLITTPIFSTNLSTDFCTNFFHYFLIFTNFPHSDFTSGGKGNNTVDDDGDDFNFFVDAFSCCKF